MEEINNPFDGEAERYVRDTGASQQVARDFVIMKYLHEAGDTRALAHWLWEGFCPGIEVRRYLSWMLQPSRDLDGDPARPARASREKVPFELVAKNRSGKRGTKPDLVAAERNRAINDRYEALKTGPGTSEAAKTDIKSLLGPDISSSMVDEATKQRTRKA